MPGDSDSQNGRYLPETGLLAWQAVVGYISRNYSPDTILKLEAYADATGKVRWAAALTWSTHRLAVRDHESIAAVLRVLWQQVEAQRAIFEDLTAIPARPSDYSEADWLDMTTHDVLHRLLWTIQTAFKRDWTLYMVYHPAEKPVMRMQLRLISPNTGRNIGGRGPSLRDAARDLFRNAVPAFADLTGLQGE